MLPPFTTAMLLRSAIADPAQPTRLPATVRDTLRHTASENGRSCENCGATSLKQFSVPGRAQLWHCTDCDLYQGGTLPSVSVYEDAYHDGYVQALARKTLTAHARLGKLQPLLEQDQPRKSPKILDIGCSIGATLTAATELGWDPYGVDVSQSAVESCRQRGLNCKVYDGGRLPYEDASFDLLTSWHVIEHVTDVRATLAEWYRVLKPGGLMILETPHAKCWKARLLGRNYRKFWPAEHLYTFTPNNLTPFVTDAGLEPLPLPNIVWPRGLSTQQTAYSVVHQAYLATTKLTKFCKSFQVLARRPWSSIRIESSAA